jgi:hypothetical protein
VARQQAEARPETVRNAVGHQPAAEHSPVAVEVRVVARRVGGAVVVPEAAGAAHRLT